MDKGWINTVGTTLFVLLILLQVKFAGAKVLIKSKYHTIFSRKILWRIKEKYKKTTVYLFGAW